MAWKHKQTTSEHSLVHRGMVPHLPIVCPLHAIENHRMWKSGILIKPNHLNPDISISSNYFKKTIEKTGFQGVCCLFIFSCSLVELPCPMTSPDIGLLTVVPGDLWGREPLRHTAYLSIHRALMRHNFRFT